MDTVMSAVNAQVKWVRLTNVRIISLARRSLAHDCLQALQALQFTILTNDARRHIAVPPSPQVAVWWCYGDARTIMYKVRVCAHDSFHMPEHNRHDIPSPKAAMCHRMGSSGTSIHNVCHHRVLMHNRPASESPLRETMDGTLRLSN